MEIRGWDGMSVNDDRLLFGVNDDRLLFGLFSFHGWRTTDPSCDSLFCLMEIRGWDGMSVNDDRLLFGLFSFHGWRTTDPSVGGQTTVVVEP